MISPIAVPGGSPSLSFPFSGGSPLSSSPLVSSAVPGPALTGPSLPSPVTPTAEADPFGSAFASLLHDTVAAEANAQQSIETGLLGGDITQAELMTAVKKADLSVRLLMQIRNKVLGAYNEIQAMKF